MQYPERHLKKPIARESGNLKVRCRLWGRIIYGGGPMGLRSEWQSRNARTLIRERSGQRSEVNGTDRIISSYQNIGKGGS